jgi:arylsulfatase A-like enzyme
MIESSHRNILILHTDAQMHDWLGAAGHPDVQTPHLDQLAREGVRFAHAQACSGVCKPSRASLMTGRYPVGTGVTCLPQTLPASEMTMGRYFAAAGYDNGYFGKTHYGVEDAQMAADGWGTYFGVKQYNQYLAETGVNLRYPEKEVKQKRARFWNLGQSSIPEEHYFEKVVADRAMAFIDRERDRPFLCMTSWIAPHGPFTPPGRFAAMYYPSGLTLAPRHDAEVENKPREFVDWVRQNQKYANEEELRQFLAMVYGLVSLVDEQVGRIMACLRERGLLESTLILFASDHGDYGTGYGIFGKSWNMIDPLIRIPLIARAPGSAGAGKPFEGLVENIDLLPTMMEFAGLGVPRSVQGRSFWPLLEAKSFDAKQAAYSFNLHESTRGGLAQATIRSGRWRLIVGDHGPDQLYDVANDPWNWVNLADRAEHRATVGELKDQLLRWQIGAAGLGYDRESARYWEDETLFWDETQFTGERVRPRGREAAQ